MKLAVVIAFLNEERNLPRLLHSISAQTRQPEELVLVDDGSTDGSNALACSYARDRSNVRVLRRPPQTKQLDRLSTAAELKAFMWGVEQLKTDWDVLVKFDGDLELKPDHIEHVLAQLAADPSLGICGAYLAVEVAGRWQREQHPEEHVRGASKFYRRSCFEAVSPLPSILGWDTIDELSARMHGWTTRTVALPDGDSLHLRPTGLHDGRLRAMRRWGVCAWSYGATPMTALTSAVARLRRPPAGLAALNYLYGYVAAAARRTPRATPEVLAWSRREQRRRLREALQPRRAVGRSAR